MSMWRAKQAQKSGYRVALLIIGALLAAVIGPAVPAEAYVKLGCKFGGIDPTIYYSFNPVLSSIRRTATTSGAARWNAVSVPGVFVAWSAGHTENVKVTEWSAIDSYEAQTVGQCSGGLWVGSTVTFTWNSPSPGGVSGNATAMCMIATDELGHAYGLNHTPNTSCSVTKSVMTQGSVKWSCGWGTEPWADDINGVNAVY